MDKFSLCPNTQHKLSLSFISSLFFIIKIGNTVFLFLPFFYFWFFALFSPNISMVVFTFVYKFIDLNNFQFYRCRSYVYFCLEYSFNGSNVIRMLTNHAKSLEKKIGFGRKGLQKGLLNIILYFHTILGLIMDCHVSLIFFCLILQYFF